MEKRIILQLHDVKMWNVAFAQWIEVACYITKEPNKKNDKQTLAVFQTCKKNLTPRYLGDFQDNVWPSKK